MPKLNSVLKNVPIELRNELVKYHTKNSRHRLRWKGREPKPGKKYSKWGGSLSLENAKSADLYVDNIESKKERGNMWLENYTLKSRNKELLAYTKELNEQNNELRKLLPIRNGIDAIIDLIKERI
tara:strand:- start:286 stop:660 length:375 start_codon:yes stop_codon:yes gene_type:complete